MGANDLAKGYEPHQVEEKWYRFWETNKLFAAASPTDKPTYSIVIPPPNVTGVLHMGHALNVTLQDILCRYRRLRGDSVLWMPGTDHAGIATQNVVEKKLSAEGTTRHALGRDKFIDAVWQWREEYGSAIINQLKRLGASCDWDRERFTMDDGLSRAVRTVFVHLYKEGLIYRGNYIINWCPRCSTALSDLEVEHEEIDGHLYHIRYPFVGQTDGLVVATTRPETMLGDTAVAVHPEDERYLNLAVQTVLLPLMQREIPIIKDTYVDREFGTGALKVTPAHDPNDFEIGRRHQLPEIKVIDDNGVMTEDAGRFKGLDRFVCRKAVVKELEQQGLLVRVEPIKHGVGHCYRCKDVVEPNLSKQWFVKVKPLAEKAIEAVESGRTRIVPEVWINTYYDWMHNIRDWCISRQIWWGHRIPAWTCDACGDVMVAMETPTRCGKCGGEHLERETDVLDTWFSSALWPFSTMGWPEKTPVLDAYYPTATLVTGFDILFFWVARMMMMGLHFMAEVPFKDVYVHALVRDEHGKKMSKSKGNVIDPLNVIDEYGTDAFRYTLAAFAAQGRDIKMSEKRVEGYRHFVNKLWNAARFALMHLDGDKAPIAGDHLALADRWVLSRLNQTMTSVSGALDGYRFNEAAAILYKFVWHEFCDWYLEAAKPALYGSEGDDRKACTKAVLAQVLADTLILLHPFMPFVTEEIWHKLPLTDGSIMRSTYPADREYPPARPDDEAENAMAVVMAAITGVRNVRGEMNIAPAMALDVTVQTEDEKAAQVIEQQQALIKQLARLNTLAIQPGGNRRPQGAATAVIQGATLFVSLEGIIDFDQERKRLEKEIGKLAKELAGVNKKLNNEDFLSKAPAPVVEKVKARQADLLTKQKKLENTLAMVQTAEKG